MARRTVEDGRVTTGVIRQVNQAKIGIGEEYFHKHGRMNCNNILLTCFTVPFDIQTPSPICGSGNALAAGRIYASL